MERQVEPAPQLGYAGADPDEGARRRRPRGAAIGALLFAVGVVVGTLPAHAIIAADVDGIAYPDIDGPNVSAGMLLQLVYGTPAVFVITYLPCRSGRRSILLAAAGGALGGVLYALLPDLLWLNHLRPPAFVPLSFFLGFPVIVGWILAR